MNKLNASLCYLLILQASLISADQVLDEANQVREQEAEYNQELQQNQGLQEDYNLQNQENQNLDNEIDQNPLLAPTPTPLWNDSSEGP